MKKYLVYNPTNGDAFGAYEGETEEEAIRAMMTDAGSDEEPWEDIRADEVVEHGGWCLVASEDGPEARHGVTGRWHELEYLPQDHADNPRDCAWTVDWTVDYGCKAVTLEDIKRLLDAGRLRARDAVHADDDSFGAIIC